MPSCASIQSEVLPEQTADSVALWAHCTHQIFRRADALMVVLVDVESHMDFSSHGIDAPYSSDVAPMPVVQQLLSYCSFPAVGYLRLEST